MNESHGTANPPQENPNAPRLRVMCVPARDKSDEVALLMLGGLLDSGVYDVIATTTALLASEVIDRVEQDQPDVLCVAAVAPGGVAQARLLCLRLRARFPGLRILVGRWSAKSGLDKIRAQLLTSGAADFGTTLEETVHQLDALRALGTSPARFEPQLEGASAAAPV
jgi:hypothetical protein